MAFDPDAYLQEPDTGSTAPKFDPDAYLTAGELPVAHAGPSGRHYTARVPVGQLHSLPAQPSPVDAAGLSNRDEMPQEAGVGAGETLATMGTSAIAAPVAGWAGVGQAAKNVISPGMSAADRVAQVKGAMTYQPRTEAGQRGVEQAGTGYNPMNWVGNAADWAADRTPGGPLAQTAVKTGINAIPFLLGGGASRVGAGAAAGEAGAAGAAETLDQAGSMGAARAYTDVSKASPELQAAIAKIPPQNRNPVVLSRHVEADSLPVPMRITHGQATGDPAILSDEMNNRGATGLDKVHNLQDQQLRDNMRAIRDNAGPDVFSTNPVEHGDTLIEAYKAKDAPISADIDAKYQALRDAAGGDFPVDGQAFVANARGLLKKGLLSNDVPASIAADLKGFEAGEPMTFEDFESLRTKLAREGRDNPNGNARAAVGNIRQALEDLPLKGDAAALKPIADEARAAAKARFAALEADPAYKAAVTDSVPPDQFISKFVTGKTRTATRDSVETMRQNLADNPGAIQTMSVATLDELRKSAGLDADYNGIFGQKRFNDRLQDLSAKIPSLFDNQTSGHLETLGNVARYIKAQPAGNVINNSGTLSGALAHHATNVVGSVLNAKTGGLAGPVLEHFKGSASKRALNQKLQEATAPLAGVEKALPK
jgi:hypothetical protein